MDINIVVVTALALFLEETPAVTQQRVEPTLWTMWVWFWLSMFNTWHSLILSQQASGRRQLAGGGRVQNQPSQQVEDFHADIMTEKKNYMRINSPRVTLIYHQSDVQRIQVVALRWSHGGYFLMYSLHANLRCLFLFQIGICCISQNDFEQSLEMDDYFGKLASRFLHQHLW